MELIVAIAVWVVAWLCPVGALLFVGQMIIGLPLRRQERIRSFLILLDAGLKDGRRVEDTIVSLARVRDPGLGPRFQALAALLQTGTMRLSEALDRVPDFLPPQVVAMLRVGEKLGDLRKVLPACRHLMKDSLALTRSSVHYIIIAAFATTPVMIAILAALQIYVLPQFQSVMQGLDAETPASLVFLSAHKNGLLGFQVLLLLFVWLVASFYIGAPPLFSWLEKLFPAATARFFYTLSWRRKRLQRDFATMLALLLDGGVPEPEALSLAADCTANKVFIRRGQNALAALAEGRKLPEAVQMLDDTHEFRWRFANAFHAHGGFYRAIVGWIDSLDAKAFQQEQAAAQVITTSLVLLNGVFVGVIVVSVFSVLVSIINNGTLW